MIFNSYSFFIFAILFFGVFFFLSKKIKLVFLLISSYIFYGWWNPWFLGLIFISTLIDFNIAQKVEQTENPVKRKQFLLLSIFANLGILGFFKYFNFFVDSFQILTEQLGLNTSTFYLNILLPVGISFYTFQTLGYTIDVYRRKIKAEKSLLNFAVYVAYFPQLVAGPIERASNLLPQIDGILRPTDRQIKEGVWLLTWGFFLKVVIADNVAQVVEATFEHHNPYVASRDIWIAVPAFCLQIYGDFAGYSKIARGISKFIGIDLARNFNHPFFAFSPSDFWRRWHITLSEWLRDYLYISLGGNRLGNLLTLRNLMITMLLGGLWHGASWVYVLWGFYHGSLLIIYRLSIDEINFLQSKMMRPFMVAIMFFLSLYGWLIFRANDMVQLKEFSYQFFTFNFFGLSKAQGQIYMFWIVAFYTIVILHDAIAEWKNSEYVLSLNRHYHLIPLFILICSIYFFGAKQSEFIYFQF